MTPRRFPWTTALLVAGGLAFAGLVGTYLWAMREVVHAWYEAEYAPERLSGPTPQVPARARVADVPWHRQVLDRGPALSMKMLAAQHGRELALTTIEFAMGTTWGATVTPRQYSFTPGADADVGFRQGAPLMGFTRRYLVTDDATRFVAEVQAALAKGRAVRVVVDLPTLRGQPPIEEGSPRDLVLIGFDADEFEFYDPVCENEHDCADAPAGAPGLKISRATLLEAVDRQALRYKYPWTFQLLLIEPSTSSLPVTMALERNARALVGTKSGGRGPATGSWAIADLAQVVSKSGRDGFSATLERACHLSARVRADDAKALRELFPEATSAAVKLDQAAEAFARAAASFDKKEPFALTDALLAASAADQEAGAALLSTDAGTR